MSVEQTVVANCVSDVDVHGPVARTPSSRKTSVLMSQRRCSSTYRRRKGGTPGSINPRGHLRQSLLGGPDEDSPFDRRFVAGDGESDLRLPESGARAAMRLVPARELVRGVSQRLARFDSVRGKTNRGHSEIIPFTSALALRPWRTCHHESHQKGPSPGAHPCV